MIRREREAEFLKWLRGRLSGVAEGLSEGTTGMRVSAMREAGGVDYREAEAQTVAFQVEFHTIEEARLWNARKFSTLAAEFEEAFGPDAMVFVSMFEEMGLS